MDEDLPDVRDAPTYTADPQYPIASVDNALKVLLLVGQRRTIRLTAVSRYLGIATSSAHRLLAMLQYRGFIRQQDNGRAYVAGPGLDDLAKAAPRDSGSGH